MPGFNAHQSSLPYSDIPFAPDAHPTNILNHTPVIQEAHFGGHQSGAIYPAADGTEPDHNASPRDLGTLHAHSSTPFPFSMQTPYPPSFPPYAVFPPPFMPYPSYTPHISYWPPSLPRNDVHGERQRPGGTQPHSGEASRDLVGERTTSEKCHVSEADKIVDALDWPSSSVRREEPINMDDKKWKQTKWQWRSQGNRPSKGGAEVRVCLGVFQCITCLYLIWPKMDPAQRQIQLQQGCRNPRCRDSKLVLHACQAKVFHYRVTRDGQEFLVWEHEGEHAHPRPPGVPLSKAEEVAFDAQVLRRPGASAHELRTRDTAPDSVPLAEITPVLANPRAARYEMSKSHAHLGLLPAAGKGAFGVLHSLGSLNEKLKQEFIINSSFTGPTFFIMQTEFMKQIITDSVEDWILLAAGGPDAGHHGFVTDADQSFFRDGHLIVTCTFSTVLC
ncbi:hypothetical protein SCP_1403230 [Sparassis crispa]|uniref:GCM domain-containing protein n=1 Tax=Sparassis crispa TaxID=139825 RepID=A0A401H398_9APHY|nr:hypothetical protein SCP_1403230 [Sparassis crispa]GBE88915.1 hypothetical protein SCP_1403230 [Sparassis crispa]